jgi:hypothetical protein
MQVHSSCLFQSLPERPATIACPRHCSEEVCRAAIVEEQVGPLPVGRNKTRQDRTRQDRTRQGRKDTAASASVGTKQQDMRNNDTSHFSPIQLHQTRHQLPQTCYMLAIVQSMCLPATDMYGAPIRHRYRIIVGRLLDL